MRQKLMLNANPDIITELLVYAFELVLIFHGIACSIQMTGNLERFNGRIKPKVVAVNDEVILVTGGVGFVGGHLSQLLLSKGYKVIVYDIFNSDTTPVTEKIATAQILAKTAIEHKHKNASLKIIIGDIRDEKKLQWIIKSFKITSCFHMAALVDDRTSVHTPFEYIDTNIKGTVTLFKCLSDNGIKTIIQASTRSVFGHIKQNNENTCKYNLE